MANSSEIVSNSIQFEMCSLDSIKHSSGDGNDEYKTEKTREKETIAVYSSPMGDYDYDSEIIQESSDCSSADFGDEIKLNYLSSASKDIIRILEDQIEETFTTVQKVAVKTTEFEDDFLKRRELYDQLKDLCNDQATEILKFTEKNENVNFTLVNLENKIKSWQYLIDEFKKVPGESI